MKTATKIKHLREYYSTQQIPTIAEKKNVKFSNEIQFDDLMKTENCRLKLYNSSKNQIKEEEKQLYETIVEQKNRKQKHIHLSD